MSKIKPINPTKAVDGAVDTGLKLGSSGGLPGNPTEASALTHRPAITLNGITYPERTEWWETNNFVQHAISRNNLQTVYTAIPQLYSLNSVVFLQDEAAFFKLEKKSNPPVMADWVQVHTQAAIKLWQPGFEWSAGDIALVPWLKDYYHFRNLDAFRVGNAHHVEPDAYTVWQCSHSHKATDLAEPIPAGTYTTLICNIPPGTWTLENQVTHDSTVWWRPIGQQGSLTHVTTTSEALEFFRMNSSHPITKGDRLVVAHEEGMSKENPSNWMGGVWVYTGRHENTWDDPTVAAPNVYVSHRFSTGWKRFADVGGGGNEIFPFDATHQYALGNVVEHNGDLYIARVEPPRGHAPESGTFRVTINYNGEATTGINAQQLETFDTVLNGWYSFSPGASVTPTNPVWGGFQFQAGVDYLLGKWNGKVCEVSILANPTSTSYQHDNAWVKLSAGSSAAITALVNANTAAITKNTTDIASLASGIKHGAAVLDIITDAPASPADGALYIVKTKANRQPSDPFLNHDNHIAHYTGGVWSFEAPTQDEAHLSQHDNSIYHWNGTVWNNIGSVGSGKLADLTDVSAASAANNALLHYNATTKKWETGSIPAYSLGGTTLINGQMPGTRNIVQNIDLTRADWNFLNLDFFVEVRDGNCPLSMRMFNAQQQAQVLTSDLNFFHAELAYGGHLAGYRGAGGSIDNQWFRDTDQLPVTWYPAGSVNNHIHQDDVGHFQLRIRRTYDKYLAVNVTMNYYSHEGYRYMGNMAYYIVPRPGMSDISIIQLVSSGNSRWVANGAVTMA